MKLTDNKLLAMGQVFNGPRNRTGSINDEDKKLPFRIGNKIIMDVLNACTDEATPKNSFEKRYYDWYDMEKQNVMPPLTPNQLFDRLFQLTNRQKPNSKGFLSGNPTIIGKTQLGQRTFSVILYCDSNYGKPFWKVYEAEMAEHRVEVLV